jgi:hypothetical protein
MQAITPPQNGATTEVFNGAPDVDPIDDVPF